MNLRTLSLGIVLLAGCGSSSGSGGSPAVPPKNPDTEPVVAVDRFSDSFAHLFARSKNAALPAANAPIAFDSGPPFITHGFGPKGEKVTYYNFDVLPSAPAPIYVFFKQGEANPVSGQLNVIDMLPGEPGYNDFWNVTKVTVPANYVANTVTSAAAINAAGYPLSQTTMLVNCPVVPDGSTAMLRYTAAEPRGLQRGWYKDKVVKYFTFAEQAVALDAKMMVPLSPIFVSFNINPDPKNAASGPPSGFKAEPGTTMTHNVPSTLPGDPSYSPLWTVQIYDNSAFAMVADLTTATKAPLLAPDAVKVNCPLVAKQ